MSRMPCYCTTPATSDQRLATNRGLTILEYTVLILAVTAGLLAMQRLLTGAVGGAARQAADAFGSGQQLDANFVPEH